MFYLFTVLIQLERVTETQVRRFLPSIKTCLGAQKIRVIETVLLSTHYICLGREIRKPIFWVANCEKVVKCSTGLAFDSFPQFV